MLRLLYALGVLVRLSTLSILALPSKDRGVAVALLVRSTSAHGAEVLTHCLAEHMLHTAAAPRRIGGPTVKVRSNIAAEV